MSQLKLVALDEADLTVISAHVQDAVMKIADLDYLPAQKRFVAALNRYVWENAQRLLAARHERRRAVLHFDRVLSVKSAGLDRERPDEVLSLLALRFEPAEPPAGIVELVFSGGATVRLEVECIEARLADLDAAWAAVARPRHDD